MKKKFILALSLFIALSGLSMAYSKTNVSSELAEAIKMYKIGNYSQCYTMLDDILKKEQGNALAYYYKAIASVQLGKKAEAEDFYEKTISIAPQGSNLYKYSQRGLVCIQTPDKCNTDDYETEEDKFIRSVNSSGFSEEVRGQYERLKIENLMREMNRNEDIPPARFKEFKDFSSMNTDNAVPTNDEIVAAIRVLQKAGLYNNNGSVYSDLSLLTGKNYGSNPYLDMTGGQLNPQLIQAMLTNNMSLGF